MNKNQREQESKNEREREREELAEKKLLLNGYLVFYVFSYC